MFPKLDELRLFVSSLDIDVLCISETWLNHKILDEDVDIHGYKCFRKDRIGKTGGGVAIYLKDSIVYKERNDLTTINDTEMVWVEIVTKSSRKNVLIASMYRPPNSNTLYYEQIIDALEKANYDI